MSEYQYYEFRAIDRPLTDNEQATLRRYSGRATITPTRFLNNYSYGSFKGNESEWTEKYFDAFLYLANWGTRKLMLRLPVSVLPMDSVSDYCAGDMVSARIAGEHIILEFRSEDEECDGGWIDEDDDTLAGLVPMRAELASGDVRALYIAWLGSARLGELEDDDREPPCPPGLRELSHALEAFAALMRVDSDLIEAAAATSPDLIAIDGDAIRLWVSALPEVEKTLLIVRLVGGGEAHLRAELVRRFHHAYASKNLAPRTRLRTVGELLKAADTCAEQRRRHEAESAARENARRARADAEVREQHLTALAKREAAAWREVDALIATKQAKKYDEAVALLHDLRDVCARDGRQTNAAARVARLRAEHAKKPSFVERLRKAGMLEHESR